MASLSAPDFAALAFFVIAWAGYHIAIEHGWGESLGLNQSMDQYRRRWMQQMADRDSRIVDSGIMASLQNGTAFFASTSLLAIGGVATLLRTPDDAIRIFSEIPVGQMQDRVIWEIKVIGLLLILGHAFFKFAWSYRLFNYTAILIGATPPRHSPDKEERDQVVAHASAMLVVAGSHFTRGQRAFFFALAYLGWFLGPWAFFATTAATLFVMGKRQFASDARIALRIGNDAA